MQSKRVDADQSQKELGDGNTHHTHNAQYLIQGSSLLKGAYDPQENTEYGRHHQGKSGSASMVAGRWFFIRVSTGTPL